MSDIITIEINDEQPIETETGYGVVYSGDAADHNTLRGRSLPDQHPISAISGLEQELRGQLSADDLTEYTNQEVIALWELIMRG